MEFVKKITEAAIQKALIKWATYHPKKIIKDLISIPNGGFRNKREAFNLKLQGVKAGVSDLFFARANQNYHGLWLELKRERAKKSYPKVSDAQKDFIERMRINGYKAEIAYGLMEAIKIIEEYLCEK